MPCRAPETICTFALCALGLLGGGCGDNEAAPVSDAASEEDTSELGSSDESSGESTEEDETTGDETTGDGDETGELHPCEDGVEEPGEICLELREELGSAGPANTVVLSDLDNAPGLDVALGSLSSTSMTLHFGNGGEGFLEAQNVPISQGVRDLHAADFNHDGLPDLAMVSLIANAFGVAYAQSPGEFGPPKLLAAGSMARDMAVADLDDDGDLDVVVAGESDSELRVFRNDAGVFADATPFDTGLDPYEVQVGDLNADSRPDLAVATREQGAVTVHLQLQDGSFGEGEHYPVGAGPRSLALADLNGDSALDVVTANHDEDQVAVMYGDGEGAFSAPAGYTVGNRPIAIRLGDLDNDGDMDAVVALFGQAQISVLVGDGDGGFSETREFPVNNQPISLELGHLDDDGRLDVVVAAVLGLTSVMVHGPAR